MSDKWYWKHRQDLLGPLTTAELDDLIQQKRIADVDQLRMEGEEEWLTGTDVKALFARTKNGGTLTPSEAASKMLMRPHTIREGEPSAGGGGPSILEKGIRVIGDRFSVLGEGVSLAFEFLAKKAIAIVVRLPDLRKQWVTFFVATAICAGVPLSQFDFRTSDNRKIYHEFSQTFKLVQEKLDAKAGDQDFQQLQEKYLPAIVSTREKLTTLSIRSSINNPNQSDSERETQEAQKRLIQVAYTLAEILEDGKAFNSARVLSAEKQLKGIEDIFDGKFTADRHAMQQKHRIHTPCGEKASGAYYTPTAGDPLTFGFVPVDVVVIGAAVYFSSPRIKVA